MIDKTMLQMQGDMRVNLTTSVRSTMQLDGNIEIPSFIVDHAMSQLQEGLEA